MPNAAAPIPSVGQSVYFTPDCGILDPRVGPEQTALYGALKSGFAAQVGYSSTAAGWSKDVIVERWLLPKTDGFVNHAVLHRLVVMVGSSETFVQWDDDGCRGEGLHGPGTISLMPYGLTSRTCWRSPLNIVTLEFSPTLMGRLLDERDAPNFSEQLVPRRAVFDPVAHKLALRILAELATPTERLYGEMLCLAFAAHVLDAHGRARVNSAKGRLSIVQARRVLDYMHSHMDGSLSVSALAAVAGLSEAHFARAFRATFNEPPHKLALRWRLERAARLIRTKNANLAEVAVAAGFCDQAHFTNAMRRHYGQPPGALLKSV
jgi:AraC family transcriptional regulator